MSKAKKTVALIIMDGWGYRPDQNDNAIAHAKTPVLDKLWQNCPSMLISSSGLDVGLPDGQMGNSEVGHVNIGAGRVVYQDLTKIDKAIIDGDFFTNSAIVNAVDSAVKNDKAVHILGLASPGGVHSHDNHILAMIDLAAKQGATKIYLHAFLDGRDTPPRSAQVTLDKFDAKFAEIGTGKVASLIGRYFALDRDNRWDRVEQAYRLLTESHADYRAESATAGLEAAYAREENDEFVKATVIGDDAPIQDGDAVIFMNFRADRAREITRSFVNADFSEFERKVIPALADFVMLTEYAADIKTSTAFPADKLVNTLGSVLEQNNKTQLRISETEKYAHVTFFFNGGLETPFVGEDRELIPSPQVATYDLQPEMNSELLTDKLVAAIDSEKYDVIICNYPNGDMVGHTGVFDAAVKACEAVDRSVGRVIAALEKTGGECLITADHGNAEMMVNPATGGIHTAHTNLPVPLIYFGRNAVPAEKGSLCDLAPTILSLIGEAVPAEMTGNSLMNLK